MNSAERKKQKRTCQDLKTRAKKNPSAPQLVAFIEEKYTKLTEVRKYLA